MKTYAEILTFKQRLMEQMLPIPPGIVLKNEDFDALIHDINCVFPYFRVEVGPDDIKRMRGGDRFMVLGIEVRRYDSHKDADLSHAIVGLRTLLRMAGVPLKEIA